MFRCGCPRIGPTVLDSAEPSGDVQPRVSLLTRRRPSPPTRQFMDIIDAAAHDIELPLAAYWIFERYDHR